MNRITFPARLASSINPDQPFLELTAQAGPRDQRPHFNLDDPLAQQRLRRGAVRIA